MPPSAPVTPASPRTCTVAPEPTGPSRGPEMGGGPSDAYAARGLAPRQVVSVSLPRLTLAANVSGRFCTGGCPPTLVCTPPGKAAHA